MTEPHLVWSASSTPAPSASSRYLGELLAARDAMLHEADVFADDRRRRLAAEDFARCLWRWRDALIGDANAYHRSIGLGAGGGDPPAPEGAHEPFQFELRLEA